MRWYKLEGKIPIPVDIIKHPEELDMMQDGKRLHLTTLPCGGMVSTVFLNLDHSFGGDVPVLFETMLFVSEDDYTDLDIIGRW
jgi:hypothetical protein